MRRAASCHRHRPVRQPMPAVIRVAGHFTVVGFAAIGAGALLGVLFADRIVSALFRGDLLRTSVQLHHSHT